MITILSILFTLSTVSPSQGQVLDTLVLCQYDGAANCWFIPGQPCYAWPTVDDFFGLSGYADSTVTIKNEFVPTGSPVGWSTTWFNYDDPALGGIFTGGPYFVYTSHNNVLLNFLDSIELHVNVRPQVCLVTATPNGDMEIVVESSSMVGYDTVAIYRNGSGTDYIGKIDKNVSPILTDVSVLPTQAWQYTARATGCTDLGLDAEPHQSIYLWNNNGQLSWEDYLVNGDASTELSGYAVLQLDTVTFVWDTVGTVDISSSNWFNAAMTPSYYTGAIYQIQAVRDPSCDLGSGKTESTDGSIILSNPSSVLLSNVGINESEPILIQMINPSNGLHLTTGRPMNVSIHDLNGRSVATYRQITSIDKLLESGTYFITLKNGSHVTTKRLVVVN